MHETMTAKLLRKHSLSRVLEWLELNRPRTAVVQYCFATATASSCQALISSTAEATVPSCTGRDALLLKGSNRALSFFAFENQENKRK